MGSKPYRGRTAAWVRAGTKPDNAGCEHIQAESSKKASNDLCGSETVRLSEEPGAEYLTPFQTALCSFRGKDQKEQWLDLVANEIPPSSVSLPF